MSLQLGTIAPNFEALTTMGTFDFHDWKDNQWAIFFSHPADYTPVCTTELGMASKMAEKFARKNCKFIALSVDGLESHKGWINDIESTQNTKMNLPIVADEGAKVANLYGMIHPKADDKLTVRSVFFIDPTHKIRATLTYPPATGRNFDELYRVLEALQLTDQKSVATPANWKSGDDVVIVPSLKDEALLKAKFPKGFEVLTPYLRITPQPDLD